MFNEHMSRQAIRAPDEQFEEDIRQIYKLDIDTSNIYSTGRMKDYQGIFNALIATSIVTA